MYVCMCRCARTMPSASHIYSLRRFAPSQAASLASAAPFGASGRPGLARPAEALPECLPARPRARPSRVAHLRGQLGHRHTRHTLPRVSPVRWRAVCYPLMRSLSVWGFCRRLRQPRPPFRRPHKRRRRRRSARGRAAFRRPPAKRPLVLQQRGGERDAPAGAQQGLSRKEAALAALLGPAALPKVRTQPGVAGVQRPRVAPQGGPRGGPKTPTSPWGATRGR